MSDLTRPSCSCGHALASHPVCGCEDQPCVGPTTSNPLLSEALRYYTERRTMASPKGWEHVQRKVEQTLDAGFLTATTGQIREARAVFAVLIATADGYAEMLARRYWETSERLAAASHPPQSWVSLDNRVRALMVAAFHDLVFAQKAIQPRFPGVNPCADCGSVEVVDGDQCPNCDQPDDDAGITRRFTGAEYAAYKAGWEDALDALRASAPEGLV